MNPEFDLLLWSIYYFGLALEAHLSGEHIAHDGRLCCRGQGPAYEITITAWDGGKWSSRKLSEVRL